MSLYCIDYSIAKPCTTINKCTVFNISRYSTPTDYSLTKKIKWLGICKTSKPEQNQPPKQERPLNYCMIEA